MHVITKPLLAQVPSPKLHVLENICNDECTSLMSQHKEITLLLPFVPSCAQGSAHLHYFLRKKGIEM
jgi:hypothetical protein